MDPFRGRTTRGGVSRGTPVTLRQARVGSVGILDVLYPPGLELPRHEHEHGYLCLVAGGAFEESWSGRDRQAGAGSFLYYPDQLRHRGRYGPRGARVLHLEIPGGNVAALCPGGDDARVRRDDLRDRPAAGLAWQVLREVEAGAGGGDLAVECLVADLLAAVFGTAPRQRSGAPAWVADVEEMLRRSSGAPPRLGEIAAAVGRHPSHVARDYRRHAGSTLGQRARRLQVARAAAAIAAGELPLAQVACEAGFADQSHMGRVFRDLMGTTPASYRRRLSAADLGASVEGSAAG